MLQLNKKMKFIKSILIALLIITISGFSLFGTITTEEPEFKITTQKESVETRFYSSFIVAETVVKQEDRGEAVREGFKILVKYIQGENQKQEEIAMTAPVMQNYLNKEKSWVISFVLPKKYTRVSEAPKAQSNLIKIKQIPEKKVIAVRFSGLISDANISAKDKELRDFAKENSIKLKGTPTYAFYNPPWTIPFFRRNEIIYNI